MTLPRNLPSYITLALVGLLAVNNLFQNRHLKAASEYNKQAMESNERAEALQLRNTVILDSLVAHVDHLQVTFDSVKIGNASVISSVENLTVRVGSTLGKMSKDLKAIRTQFPVID